MFPQREVQEVNVIIANVFEGGVGSKKLEGVTVLREVAVGLVFCRVLIDCDSIVN